jgi:hypothetical protein
VGAATIRRREVSTQGLAEMTALGCTDENYFPVPDNSVFWGLPAALSVTLTAPARAPVAVGLNVTLIVQLARAANELLHVWV